MLLRFESQICVQNAPNEIPDLEQCQIAKYQKQDGGASSDCDDPRRDGLTTMTRGSKDKGYMSTHYVKMEGSEQERQLLEVLRDTKVTPLPTFDCSSKGRTVHGM